uniref:Olfactory receptor n=1 Tax=Stegastes partitus TaxID=144197 RepID=A0A3B5BAJ8_9TELE
MMNSTQVSYLRLAAYVDTGLLKYVYFLIVLCVYVFIVGANVFLIVVICVNRSLHEPMYMFLCSLFVNELYGSTGLFPLLLVQILSDVHTVPASLCYLQIYCIHCYGTVEYLSLAVMSYDRYLAICYPLQYSSHMSANRTATLIALPWLYGLLACLIMICLSSSLQLCGNIIQKVYCDNHAIIKLACADTRLLNTLGLFSSFCAVGFPFMVILYTYMQILKVCFSGSKQTRQKAVATCSPHLASVLNFTFGVSFELSQSRFDMRSVPAQIRILMSLYWFLFQPLLNPLVYGLNIGVQP